MKSYTVTWLGVDHASPGNTCADFRPVADAYLSAFYRTVYPGSVSGDAVVLGCAGALSVSNPVCYYAHVAGGAASYACASPSAIVEVDTGYFPDIAPEGASQLGAAVLLVWGLAWAFRALIRAVNTDEEFPS